MSDTKADKPSVSIVLGLGLLLVPYFCFWVLWLRPYSGKARLGWTIYVLALCLGFGATYLNDSDFDGVPNASDCAPHDAEVSASNNGDKDCDGVPDESDCEPETSTISIDRRIDADCDGTDDINDCAPEDAAVQSIEQEDADCDRDGVTNGDDCAPTDPNLPVSSSDCDGDGILDEEDCNAVDAASSTTRTDDADCDGVLTADDADDQDPSIKGYFDTFKVQSTELQAFAKEADSFAWALYPKNTSSTCTKERYDLPPGDEFEQRSSLSQRDEIRQKFVDRIVHEKVSYRVGGNAPCEDLSGCSSIRDSFQEFHLGRYDFDNSLYSAFIVSVRDSQGMTSVDDDGLLQWPLSTAKQRSYSFSAWPREVRRVLPTSRVDLSIDRGTEFSKIVWQPYHRFEIPMEVTRAEQVAKNDSSFEITYLYRFHGLNYKMTECNIASLFGTTKKMDALGDVPTYSESTLLGIRVEHQAEVLYEWVER